MASKAIAGKETTSLALMDAVSAFLRAYKTRMRAVLTDVTSGESTPSRIMIVIVLRKHGSLPMGSIAMYVGLPKSNITALVDDLEAEGLLKRRRDETDRRITHVELTAKGRALCAREYDAYEQSLASMFDVLLESERGPMLAGLTRITKALTEEDEAANAPASKPAKTRGRRE